MIRTLAVTAAVILTAAAALTAAGAADAQFGTAGPPYIMHGDQCVDARGSQVDISLCKPQQNAIDVAKAKSPAMQCKAGSKQCGQTCIPEEAACPIK